MTEFGPPFELSVRDPNAAVDHVGPRTLARLGIVDVVRAPLLAMRDCTQAPGSLLLGFQLALVQLRGSRVVAEAEDLLLLDTENLRDIFLLVSEMLRFTLVDGACQEMSLRLSRKGEMLKVLRLCSA